MKYTLKISLAALLLGLSMTSLLRADDQTVPVQPLPATTPGEGEKPPHPHMMNPQRMLQAMSEKLNLTDDQKAKILPLLQAQADQLTALHNDTSLADDERREKARAIMQSTRGQIRGLLTPDQQEKIKDLRAAHGDHPPGDIPPSPADNPPPPSN